MRDLWLAAGYAVVVGVAALVTGVVIGVSWVTGAGAASLGTGLIFLVWALPPAWCLVFQFRGRRVRHWHHPKSGIVDCRQSVGFHVGRRSW